MKIAKQSLRADSPVPPAHYSLPVAPSPLLRPGPRSAKSSDSSPALPETAAARAPIATPAPPIAPGCRRTRESAAPQKPALSVNQRIVHQRQRLRRHRGGLPSPATQRSVGRVESVEQWERERALHIEIDRTSSFIARIRADRPLRPVEQIAAFSSAESGGNTGGPPMGFSNPMSG